MAHQYKRFWRFLDLVHLVVAPNNTIHRITFSGRPRAGELDRLTFNEHNP